MKVKVANKTYQMNRREYQGMLTVASEQIRRGIYAVEKGNYAELRRDQGSVTQLKALRQQFKQAGYKVYSNGI